MYIANVTIAGQLVEVRLWQETEPGIVKADIVGERSTHVIWAPGKYDLPWVSTRSQRQRVRVLAKEVLLRVTNDVISDNRCPGTGEEIGQYESQLIKAGHVRRPCWMVVRSGKKVLRSGCVVNPENLNEEERDKAQRLVDLWNTMCRAVGRPLSFAEFKEEQAA